MNVHISSLETSSLILKTNKNRSWTAPSRTVVDRVLLLILNELETLQWNLLTQYVEGTSVTYIFNKQG